MDYVADWNKYIDCILMFINACILNISVNIERQVLT